MNFSDHFGAAILWLIGIAMLAGGVLVGVGVWLWTHVGIVWPWFWK